MEETRAKTAVKSAVHKLLDKDNAVIPIVLSSVTALTALLAAFGGADAARRNNGWALMVSVALVLVALLIGGFAALTRNGRGAAVSLTLLVIGLGVAAFATLDHIPGKPTISASITKGAPRELDVNFKRDGLGPTDQVELLVEARSYRGGNDQALNPVRYLYRASFGPDEAGVATMKFNVPLDRKPVYDVLLIKAYVPGGNDERTARCGPQLASKHNAACVLAVLPR